MSTTTTNYGLIKPDTTDPILIGQLNDNSDAIDAALKENADAIENKPDAADIPTPSTAAPAMDGTAAAGTSTDYARADHIHPSDTSKQDALTTAQLAAVNSGINSTKVEQIAMNEANIILNTNSGVKNIWKLTIPSNLPSGFTITKDTDGGYIFNGTTGSSALMCSTNIYFGSGDYVLSGCPANGSDESYRLDILRGANTNYCYGEPVVVSGFTNVSYSCRIRIAPNYTCDNLKFCPMICKKSQYDADPSYQPYAMSNAELTAAIQALQAQLANQ